MGRIHLPLRSNPKDLDFFDRMQDALDVLERQHGLSFEYKFSQELASNLVHHIYLERNERALLRLVDDFATPVRYLIIEAMTQKEVLQIGNWLGEHLPFISLKELQQEAHQNMLKDPKSLVRLAIGVGEEFDPISFEVIHQGLHSSDEQIRFRAAEAASLTQWPEFVPELENIYHNDPVAEVREMAARSLEACQRCSQKEDVKDEDV